VVVALPLGPEQMLTDQARALSMMEQAVELAGQDGPLDAVGLGSLCAVVASRGVALAEKLPMPVTNGGAATAWALLENTLAVWRHVGGPVAVIGASAPVGGVVAALLHAQGIPVVVSGRRAARGLDVRRCASPEEAVAACRVVVGAGPTGGNVTAAAAAPGTVVVDVALPGTLRGRIPRGVRVLAGEAVSLPPTWRRGFWGWLYHVLAGYGPTQAFACLIEPLVLAVQGRREPFSLGRRLGEADVRALGEGAARLGFVPRLSSGWRQVSVASLPRQITRDGTDA